MKATPRWIAGVLAALGLTVAAFLLAREPARHPPHLHCVVQPGDSLEVIGERDPTSASDWSSLTRAVHLTDPLRPLPHVRLRIPVALTERVRPEVHVAAVSGQAQVASGGFVQPLRVGQRLGEGDAIRIGNEASVALELPGGSYMVLAPDSRLRIRRPSEMTTTANFGRETGLEGAEIDTEVVTPDSLPGFFKAVSSRADAGVQDTRLYRGYAPKTGRTELEAGGSSVELTFPGHAWVWPPMEGRVDRPTRDSHIRAGLNTTAVLLQGPDRPGKTGLMTLDVVPVARTQTYRVRISPAAGLLEVSGKRVSMTAHIDVAAQPDEGYRIRAFIFHNAALLAPVRLYAVRRGAIGRPDGAADCSPDAG